jgi:hypothetical protein
MADGGGTATHLVDSSGVRAAFGWLKPESMGCEAAAMRDTMPYQTFQGALPLSQAWSSTRLSRNESMLCQ